MHRFVNCVSLNAIFWQLCVYNKQQVSFHRLQQLDMKQFRHDSLALLLPRLLHLSNEGATCFAMPALEHWNICLLECTLYPLQRPGSSASPRQLVMQKPCHVSTLFSIFSTVIIQSFYILLSAFPFASPKA